MCHVHPLPVDVVLMAVKLCCSLMKINISLKLFIKKHYSSSKFICEFWNKNWYRHSLENLIKKIDECDLNPPKSGSGRPRTACHDDNVEAVADLVQSQEDRPQTHC